MTLSSLRWMRGTFGRAPFSATPITVTPIDVKVRTGATLRRDVYRPRHEESLRRPDRHLRRPLSSVWSRRGSSAAARLRCPVRPDYGASIPRSAGPWNLREPLRQLAGDGARAEG